MAASLVRLDNKWLESKQSCQSWKSSPAANGWDFQCIGMANEDLKSSRSEAPVYQLIDFSKKEVALVDMTGHATMLASDKAQKEFFKKEKDIVQNKVTNTEFIQKKGRISDRRQEGLVKNFKLSQSQFMSKLKKDGVDFDTSETCLDELLEQRQKLWRKLGLSPLNFLLGGALGAGAGALGAKVVVAQAGKEAVRIFAGASVVGTGALVGTAVGVAGMAAYVTGAGIYYGIKLRQNSDLMELILLTKTLEKTGTVSGYDYTHRLTRGSFSKKGYDNYQSRASKKGYDYYQSKSSMQSNLINAVSSLDKSGELCGNPKHRYGGEHGSSQATGHRIHKRFSYNPNNPYSSVKKYLKGRQKALFGAKEKANKTKCKNSTINGETQLVCSTLVYGKEGSRVSQCRTSNPYYASNDMAGEMPLFVSTAPDGNSCTISSVKPESGTTAGFKINNGKIEISECLVHGNGECQVSLVDDQGQTSLTASKSIDVRGEFATVNCNSNVFLAPNDGESNLQNVRTQATFSLDKNEKPQGCRVKTQGTPRTSFAVLLSKSTKDVSQVCMNNIENRDQSKMGITLEIKNENTDSKKAPRNDQWCGTTSHFRTDNSNTETASYSLEKVKIGKNKWSVKSQGSYGGRPSIDHHPKLSFNCDMTVNEEGVRSSECSSEGEGLSSSCKLSADTKAQAFRGHVTVLK